MSARVKSVSLYLIAEWTQSRFCWITRWSESLRSPRMPSRCAACTAACRWHCSDIENAINESILTDDILQKKLIRNFSVYQKWTLAGVPIFCVCAVCFYYIAHSGRLVIHDSLVSVSALPY